MALRLSEPSDFRLSTFDYETALSHRGAGRLFHAEIFKIFDRKPPGFPGGVPGLVLVDLWSVPGLVLVDLWSVPGLVLVDLWSVPGLWFVFLPIICRHEKM